MGLEELLELEPPLGELELLLEELGMSWLELDPIDGLLELVDERLERDDELLLDGGYSGGGFSCSGTHGGAHGGAQEFGG